MVFKEDPFLWLSLAAGFVGVAAGQAACALFPSRGSVAKAEVRRSRRFARSLTFLSLGILGLVGLLVLADKSALASGMVRGGSLFFWAAFIALLALFTGFRPLTAGLPILLMSLGALCLFRLALEGWLPLRAAKAGAPIEIASLLPYAVGPSSFRGHFELSERGSIPVAQELSMSSMTFALSVEELQLTGPLGFMAYLVAAFAPTRYSAPLRFYRVSGAVAGGGISQAFAAPAHVHFLDALLTLPVGRGLEPGGVPASISTGFGLARRSRLTSRLESLVALEQLKFSLSEGGDMSIHRD